jgi:Na+-transporting methylmalonyl-CoA/oxaloacetate decarboxylase gamma subunit
VKRRLAAAAVLLIGSGVVFLIVWLLVDAMIGPIG